VEVAVLALFVGLFVVGTLIGVVLAPLGSRKRPLRVAAFGLAYCAMELVVIALAGWLWLRRMVSRLTSTYAEDWWIDSHQRLLAGALEWVLGAAGHCFDFKVIVSDASKDESLRLEEPLLVLARHGGPGDSFVLVHLLLSRYRRRLQIVLKDVLQFDPAIDILLNRMGCLFVRSTSGAGDGQSAVMADVARRLGPNGTLLIFPEGANWTPSRRSRVIRHLRHAREFEAARVATLMANVLPPRPGGVLACLQARPDLGTVVIAHAGIDRVVSMAQAWDRIPLVTPMTLRIWPAIQVPDNPEDRPAWLTTEWAVVDAWIEGYHAGQLDRPPPELP
jgi:1-acyl-sn-glycerol-3-phosphate acyltransferase